MHVGIMESTARPFDGFPGQAINEAQTRAEVGGRQSNYMTNMILPEIVQSSKNSPLGPDCVVTRDEVPDQTVLIKMDLYWLISLEKGCVECRVMVGDSVTGKRAVTHDPRVIITRKPRRFEAYCCAVCRQNFVTVVQALLHMKAFHRKGKKILIQDQNVFHDIEKAMEVPPVPLPWYVSKRSTDQLCSTTLSTTTAGSHVPTSTISVGDQPTSSDADGNPVTVLLQAIVKEYNKQVNMVLFGKDFTDVTIKFDDKTSLVARLPDLTKQSQEANKNADVDHGEKLEFQVQRLKSEDEGHETCVVRANNPALAQKLLNTALKRGVAQGSGTNLQDQDVVEKTAKSDQSEKEKNLEKLGDSSQQQVKLDSRGRPSKTVRFMLGSPDSDDDGNSSANERAGGRDHTLQAASNETNKSQEITESETAPTALEEKNAKDDEGLTGVVSQLISTASKGIISPVSPLPSTSATAASIQKEVITNASFHARFMPKNLSVPNLSSMACVASTGLKSSVVTTSPTMPTGLIRVQSWGGSDPNHRLKLSSTYTPHVPTSFDHLSRDDLRRSFAAGRSFTYAEKIKLMNKLNDEDALITQEHVKGKFIGSETSRGHIPSVASSPSIQQSVILEKPPSPTVISTSSKLKKSESDSGTRLFVGSEGRRKRRSKYDLDRFNMPEESVSGMPHHFSIGPAVKESIRSNSDGSISDKEDNDENPPTLLGLLRTNINRGDYTTGQSATNIPTPIISNADYYGSGEWASAAMQTLRHLQTTVNASKSEDHNTVKSEESEEKTSTSEPSTGNSPFVNINSSIANETPSIVSPFVPLTGSGSSSSAVDTIVALAQQITSEQAHLKHLRKQDVPSPHSQLKRSHSPTSPLLTGSEKESWKARSDTSSDERTAKKFKKEKQPTKSSKPDPSSKQLDSAMSPPRTPHIIAEEGDSLIFTDTVTDSSLRESNKFLLKFSNSLDKRAASNTGGDHSMDMPNIFTNSVETFMKVRYIEKIGKCKVCGFSAPIDSSSSDEALKSHVMEHSLKELLQAGCNGKQLI